MSHACRLGCARSSLSSSRELLATTLPLELNVGGTPYARHSRWVCLDSLKSVLTGGRVDVRGRYEFMREAISGTMSKFYMARDRKTGEIVGLKILDPKKTAEFEARFKGLKKPSEGEIVAAHLASQRGARAVATARRCKASRSW